MAAEATERRGETAKPVYAMKLVQEQGITRAAKSLRTTKELLYRAQKNNFITAVVELAAEMLWKGKHSGKPMELKPEPQVVTGDGEPAPRSSKVMIVAKVPADKADSATQILKALGAQFMTD